MKIISKSYDKPTKTLTVSFYQECLVGFDSKGFKVFKEKKQQQVFRGTCKQECVVKMKKYFAIPDIYVVHRHNYDISRSVML